MKKSHATNKREFSTFNGLVYALVIRAELQRLQDRDLWLFAYWPITGDMVKHSVIKADESHRERTRDSLFMGAKISIIDSAVVAPTVIRNLSVGGVMIDCPMGLREGVRVNLSLRNLGNVSGSVAWVRDGRAGVMFDAPINPDDIRSTITKPKVRPMAIKGASLAPLSEGSYVEVNVPGIGRLHGYVDWIDDKRMGLSFESSLLDR